MAAAPQQQQSDNSYAILWIIAILFIAGSVIWYFAQAEIVAFIIKLRLIEINIIKLFTTGLAPIEMELRTIQPSGYKLIEFHQLVRYSDEVGKVLAYPVSIILACLAVLVYVNHITLRFRKTYTMQRLIDEETKDWPQITPIAKIDLVKQHVDTGAWAMGLTPMQFAKKYRLLIEERGVQSASPGVFDPNPKVTATLSRGNAARIFMMQLGPYWQGPDRLPIYAQALYAAFAARAAGDRVGSLKLLTQISGSTNTGKLNFSGTKELLAKYRDNKHVLKASASHAFVITVMATMLILARQDGVLASADFLWLKPLDRRMWFMLNTVGRKTPFAEVGGPYAHWLVETQYSRPIKVPMIDEAVNALELAIKETLYIPDDKEE
jgi:intracellular multiplication protein IcmP